MMVASKYGSNHTHSTKESTLLVCCANALWETEYGTDAEVCVCCCSCAGDGNSEVRSLAPSCWSECSHEECKIICPIIVVSWPLPPKIPHYVHFCVWLGSKCNFGSFSFRWSTVHKLVAMTTGHTSLMQKVTWSCITNPQSSFTC